MEKYWRTLGWSLTTNRKLGEDLHSRFQRSIERIHKCNFSRVNTIRQGMSGFHSQEEICLTFSKAEGNVKVFMVRLKTCYLYTFISDTGIS